MIFFNFNRIGERGVLVSLWLTVLVGRWTNREFFLQTSRPSTSETSPRPPPQGSSSTSETGPQLPRPLKNYGEKLRDKLQEGNKEKGAVEQQRTAEGKFGAKNLLDCSWRTWIKNMYRDHPGVTCICRCNKRPLISGQALIKHIERHHYINGIVQLNDLDITIISPS